MRTNARWASGARSPLAPTEPFSGTDRMNSSIEQADQHLDDFSANSTEALGEDICAQQQHGPDFGFRQRPAQSAGMASHQIHLQFRKTVARNADVRELAETGVDAVDGHFFRENFLDDLAGCVHARQSGWREAHLPTSASYMVNFIEAEILP